MNSDVASEVSTVKVGRCDGNEPSHGDNEGAELDQPGSFSFSIVLSFF